ncbi:hypothetical protein ALC60_11711 [Trachymyrmex zeteki]|uniref:Uncharacterized protein n=1 Tax=Mycetomoellerius zeteki TaxID=64791 RepID=A0A151WN13_9HYME|nr:hypothetical protein ALC60_11711 [Trachymyrmex zeteki]
MASPDKPLDGIESRFARAVDETEWIPLSLTLVEYPQGEYHDATLIPNVLWFEYTNIRTEARARARKLSAIGRSH